MFREVRNYAILNTDYTPEDLKRGIEALSRLAIWWDFGGYRDKLFIDPFFAILTPLQFQLQLKQSFSIKVHSDISVCFAWVVFDEFFILSRRQMLRWLHCVGSSTPTMMAPSMDQSS